MAAWLHKPAARRPMFPRWNRGAAFQEVPHCAAHDLARCSAHHPAHRWPERHCRRLPRGSAWARAHAPAQAVTASNGVGVVACACVTLGAARWRSHVANMSTDWGRLMW
jgi:hypothetical protein